MMHTATDREAAPIDKKRVLILSASAGNGHVRAARALEQAFARRKDEVIVQHLDMLALSPRWLRFAASDVYEFLVDHAPNLWGRIYHQQDRSRKPRRHRRLRRFGNQRIGEKIFSAIEAFQPDLIIGSHFLHLQLLRGNEHRLPARCRLALVVTDNDAHRFWQYEGVDQYYVYSEPVREAFIARGIDAECVHVSGMPIEAKFFEHVEPGPVYEGLGFDPARRTLAFIKGIARWAWIHRDSAVERLLDATKDANVLMVVGKDDETLEAHLKEAFGARYPRLKVCRFVDNIHEVLSIADLVVAKPGGSLTAEVLAKQVPTLVMGTIPGQEEKNRDLLVCAGCAREVTEIHELVNTIQALLDHPEDLDSMRKRFARHARPDPAEIIARRELRLLRGDAVVAAIA